MNPSGPEGKWNSMSVNRLHLFFYVDKCLFGDKNQALGNRIIKWNTWFKLHMHVKYMFFLDVVGK